MPRRSRSKGDISRNDPSMQSPRPVAEDGTAFRSSKRHQQGSSRSSCNLGRFDAHQDVDSVRARSRGSAPGARSRSHCIPGPGRNLCDRPAPPRPRARSERRGRAPGRLGAPAAADCVASNAATRRCLAGRPRCKDMPAQASLAIPGVFMAARVEVTVVRVQSEHPVDTLSTAQDREHRPRSDVALVGLWHLGSVAAAAWTATGRSVLAWIRTPTWVRRRCGTRSRRRAGARRGAAVGARARLLIVVDDRARDGGGEVTHLAYDTQVGPSGRPDDPRLDEAVRRVRRRGPGRGAPARQLPAPGGYAAAAGATCSARRSAACCSRYVPENLRLGRALEDFLHPDRLVDRS